MDSSDDDSQGWEILQPTDSNSSSSASIESNYSHQSLIRDDYFALDSDLGSSWKSQEANYSDFEENQDLGCGWKSQEANYSDFEENQELGCGENFKIVGSSEEIGVRSEEIGDFGGNHELSEKEEVGFDGVRVEVEAGNDSVETENLGDELVFCEDGGMVEEIDFKAGNDSVGSENLGDQLVCGDGGMVERSESDHAGEVEGGGESHAGVVEGGGVIEELRMSEKESKELVWWMVPFEIVKFCVFRVSPGWSISIAAAVVGYVILKKRLSRMRQKSRSIPIKLAVEGKKISQFATRAARLNEAFSVVTRVTTIRPLLPAAGVTPWPMLNMR